MTQDKINKAYATMQKLIECSLPVKKARALFSMIKKMETHYQFSLSEEEKYMTECGGVPNTEGRFTFENQDDFAKFQEKMVELLNSEVEWEESPIILTESDCDSVKLSAVDILRLESFITFE